MADATNYVRTDAQGVMKIAASDVSLDSVIHAWNKGDSPEAIRSQYPSLSLEEVYGAIAWSLGHADEVEAYLKRQDAVWADARRSAASDEPPVIARLRSQRSVDTRGR
jgi:uncharacterized protein (DUF433 family)